jgi:hypothetical protein
MHRHGAELAERYEEIGQTGCAVGSKSGAEQVASSSQIRHDSGFRVRIWVCKTDFTKSTLTTRSGAPPSSTSWPRWTHPHCRTQRACTPATRRPYSTRCPTVTPSFPQHAESMGSHCSAPRSTHSCASAQMSSACEASCRTLRRRHHPRSRRRLQSAARGRVHQARYGSHGGAARTGRQPQQVSVPAAPRTWRAHGRGAAHTHSSHTHANINSLLLLMSSVPARRRRPATAKRA